MNQPFSMNQQFQQGYYDPNDMNVNHTNMEQMQNQEQYYLQMQEILYMQMYPPPPKGPYPGVTYEEYEKFNITEQQQFLKFLKDVAYYYLKSLPKYQKEMEEFLAKNSLYQMTPDEHYLMDLYLDGIKQQKEYENMLKSIEAQQKEAETGLESTEKPSQQTTQENTPLQSTIPTPQQTVTPQQQAPEGSDQPKPKKKLNLKAKAFTSEIPTPPPAPKFPKHPECIVIDNFQQNYYMYVNHFQPQTEEEYIKYPTPASTQKRMADDAAKKKKKEEEIQRAIDKRNAARQRQAEAPKATVKQEKKVELDNIEVDLSIFVDPDESRQPVNLVFIGHVDAGKSTLCGRLLLDLGEVSEADVKKFEDEAIKNNRDSWWLAYVMDQNEEERQKGKTVECGKAQFVTKNKRFILADAPGHKNYVPNMIMGACQADLAGLIISAKQGEFESGFEKGGQTQEHAVLAKSLGVDSIILAITKMDTIEWNEERFKMIAYTIEDFAYKQCKFLKIYTIPIDALSGQNISKPIDPKICSWYKGPCLIELLDQIQIPKRDENGPIRIPVLDKFKDQGATYIYGKLESGKIVDGLEVTMYPKKMPMQIISIQNMKDQRMKYAKAGENLKIRVKGIEEEDLKRGQVICNLETNPCQVSVEFQAKLKLLELPESRRIMSQGYQCMMHLHTCVEEIEISIVEAVIEQESQKLVKQNYLKSLNEGIVKIQVKNPICVEKFESLSSMGRFALRDDGKSIAFGEILKIKPWKPVQQ